MGYRGRRKSLKRVTAPKSWMLDKLGGNFAPKPSAGPHKSRECLPMAILLRNRLKYALTYDECKKIVMQRLVKVDGKVRTDKTYPLGFMDVVSIERTNEFFRILYDVKGRFVVHRIKAEEAKYKLCRVKRVQVGPKGVPFIVTNDGRTVRYPDPLVKVNDSVVLDIATGKMKDFIKFDSGEAIFRLIENEIEVHHIPWENCLAFGSDNANVMVGRKKGVYGHLLEKHPKMYLSGCVCHLIHIAAEKGNLVMVTGGHNLGRVGTITHREKHPGSFDIVHLKDTLGHTFATRLSYVFVIGKGNKQWISLPKGKGVRLTIAEERDRRLAAKAQ